jgi:long-chain acyl-CoA synthetase
MEIQRVSLFGRNEIKVYVNRPMSIVQIFSDSVKNFPDKKAVVTEEESLTYKQLDHISSTIAANLKQCGVEKGDRIGVILGNGLEFPLMTIASAKIGAIMVPINVKLAVEEMKYILEHSKVKVVVCEEEFEEKLLEVKKQSILEVPEENVFIVGGKNSFSKLLDETTQFVPINIDEEDGAYILYTSGTTGRPKGAVITHINVVHSVMNYKISFETDSTMKTLIAVPMFHVTGLVAQLLHIFYVGGTVYSMKRYQNEAYIQRVLEDKINLLFNVPTIFIMMSTSKEFLVNSFDFVKKVAFGGSPIYQQTYQMLKESFPNASLHNAYGATETTSPATLMPVNCPISKVTSVGLPVQVADIKIVNPHGQDCEIGELGELYIKGPMVIKEYWDNPQANQTSFTDGYWHSGDIGIIDAEGFVYIRDRMKDMINRAGEKIFSIEVEDVLKSHPDILEAAVIGEPDPVFGEKVKAFIVGPNLKQDDFLNIKAFCLQSLAKFKVPEEFEILDSLPRNASGKILKNTLKISGGK